MHHENRPTDHVDLTNVHATLLRTFLVDIALYAVGMILLSTYSSSEATLALAFVMICLAAIHAAWTWCKDTDDQRSS
jgi:hypothetical protein